MTVQIVTPIPPPAAKSAPERTHHFIGEPVKGRCACGAPYASPIHHDQAPWSHA